MDVLQSRHIHLVSSAVKFTWFHAKFTFVFYSVNCASIHRKIGTHITKVYVAFIQIRNFVTNTIFSGRA